MAIDDPNCRNNVLYIDSGIPIGATCGDETPPRGRLHVKVANTELEPVPVVNTLFPSGSPTYTMAKMVESGGSDDMAVDGSGTPVNFTFAPVATDEIAFVFAIHLLLSDSGNLTLSSFGAIGGGLTNGHQLEVDSNDSGVITILNSKTNAELSVDYVIDGGSGSLNDTNAMKFIINFNPPIKLTESTSDFIRYVVQDDLSGIDFLIARAMIGIIA